MQKIIHNNNNRRVSISNNKKKFLKIPNFCVKEPLLYFFLNHLSYFIFFSLHFSCTVKSITLLKRFEPQNLQNYCLAIFQRVKFIFIYNKLISHCIPIIHNFREIFDF